MLKKTLVMLVIATLFIIVAGCGVDDTTGSDGQADKGVEPEDSNSDINDVFGDTEGVQPPSLPS